MRVFAGSSAADLKSLTPWWPNRVRELQIESGSAPAQADWGRRMTERSWFYASNGQQQGPIPEAQFRDLIAQGSVTPDTLVWSDGMAGWQRAGDVPGLMA